MTDKNRTSAEQCIIDMTECPICSEVLRDNRSLPCLHTFCLKCLESYKKTKPKGRTLSCPVCRREQLIPRYVVNLPRNFFIDKLIEAHNIKEQDSLPKLCDICSEDTNAVQATRFCCDCRQFLCPSCEKQHKKIKATTSHKTIDSATVSDPQELAPRQTYCIDHTTKEIEVYCQDCKMVICWQCKAISHSCHNSIEIGCAAKNLVKRLEEHIEEISEHLLTKQNAILKLTQREKSYTDEIDASSANVCNEMSRLYRQITDNGDKLKKALTASTTGHLNTIQELRGKLETNMNELKKHKVYIEQMIHLGNVRDLCEYTDKLISKTARLAEETTCEIDVPPVTNLSESVLQDLLTGKRTDIDLQHYNWCMDSADMSSDNTSYLLDDKPPIDESSGSYKDESSLKYEDWSLTRTIRTEDGLGVCGLTVLDSILYIVSQNSNNIQVYSLTESVFLRTVTVVGLVNPNDIVSCKFNNSLYICDWSTTSIFRIEIWDEMEQMNWSTDGDIGCLSVTTKGNILLAGYRSNKLKEYTSKGELICLISLEDDFKPWHAIRLISSDFLICQGPSSSGYHRVCTAGLDGKLQKLFGGVKGSDEEHLYGPYHLAVDKSGYILVADCNNRRILLLSPSLKFIKEVIPSSGNVLRRGRRMHLDEVTGRLYVADNTTADGETKDGRILVFSIS